MNYIFLIVGFVLLIKGADIFVDGAASIAKKLGIPAVIVGLTIVSLGTSAPEMAVSLISSLQGNNGITIGNVLGSNIFNTLVVIGATSIVMPILIKKSVVMKDYLVNLVVAILLYVLTFMPIIFGKEPIISRIAGVILLLGAIAFTVYLIIAAKNTNEVHTDEEKEELENIKIINCVVKIIIGLIGVVVGGKIVVDSATNIAYSFGMSEKLVGLTIVAIGTSLPELVTSVVAATKGENDIAVGNVLGSNIYNILLILGASATIHPIPVLKILGTDMIFLVLGTLVVGGCMFLGKEKKKNISRGEGVILVGMYVLYTVYIIMRN